MTKNKSVERKRQTKIVATLGPASSDKAMIRKLFEAGVDVFRLNFSHGSHEDHKSRLKIIRDLEIEFQRPISVLADLQGPKLRIGRFENDSISVHKGHQIRFDLDKSLGNEERVNLPHPEVLDALHIDSTILLDDGKVRIRITEKGDDYLIGEIEAGSKLSNNKGFNIPDVVLPIPALTKKDRKDLDAALAMGADWIAQSFVQKPSDVAEAKKLIAGRAALVIKVEKPSALEHLEEMIDLADGVMIARGDLGVEIPAEDVPAVQKKMVRMVRAAGKPIIVATQMLESMIESARPTRAEASDVATAVYDGADAVMLSAETAAGDYPIEAVTIMDKICRRVEQDDLYPRIMDAEHPDTEESASDAITSAAFHVAKDVNAACIVNYTTSGTTALRTARHRPNVPILCLTQSPSVARRLVLSYGVHPVYLESVTDFDSTVDMACEIAQDRHLAVKNQRIVMTAGVPFGTPGSTNNLRIAWIK